MNYVRQALVDLKGRTCMLVISLEFFLVIIGSRLPQCLHILMYMGVRFFCLLDQNLFDFPYFPKTVTCSGKCLSFMCHVYNSVFEP